MFKHTIAVLLFGSLQAQHHVLDLTTKPRSTDQEYLAVPASERADRLPPMVVTSHSTPDPQTPFELFGLGLDRTAYTMGDEFLVEVSLRYLGTDPISFPISTETFDAAKARANTITVQN